jgi:hypothetical protein
MLLPALVLEHNRADAFAFLSPNRRETGELDLVDLDVAASDDDPQPTDVFARR